MATLSRHFTLHFLFLKMGRVAVLARDGFRDIIPAGEAPSWETSPHSVASLWARMESNHRPSDYESGGSVSIASTLEYYPRIRGFILRGLCGRWLHEDHPGIAERQE